ncbi:MAG: SRPBCC family protein [Ilumatobacteraceae bacterium]
MIAPAEELFALVADPRRHHEFDGSGTVQRTLDVSDDVVGLGTTFGMSMKMGVPYSMKNTIVEWEPGRRVAWRTEGGKAWMNRLLGGRVWRYEFEPRDDGTLVRETWDVSQEKFPLLVKPLAGATRKNMAKTLERLAELTESS